MILTSKRRSCSPNVDFYSGIILEAMGFPTSMFTPIFALSRTVGWISQWKEMIADPQNKIGRPRQLYLAKPPAIMWTLRIAKPTK